MLDLKVTIDDNSGFCFGVVYAIQMAEDYLDEYGKLYCLGDIVHNDEEVARLTKKGLVTIDHEQLKQLRGERVLIRAHGEPPSTYRLALENDLELIDASCPVVLKLQHRVREAFDDSDAPIYIYGKHGHAEVKGLVGQTNGEAVVFEDIAELEDKELPSKLTLFSQTTKDMRKLYGIKSRLEERGVEVKFNDTLCRQVSNRDLELRDFVKNYDHIVFVSGVKSSNGKVLYNVCKEFNPNSHFVSSADEIQKDWFTESQTVGICGATSTPLWLMEQVKQRLESL
jgi:4-hydroxy-3-methylbut-2-en-1-yl diphosphate reductase